MKRSLCGLNEWRTAVPSLDETFVVRIECPHICPSSSPLIIALPIHIYFLQSHPSSSLYPSIMFYAQPPSSPLYIFYAEPPLIIALPIHLVALECQQGLPRSRASTHRVGGLLLLVCSLNFCSPCTIAIVLLLTMYHVPCTMYHCHCTFAHHVPCTIYHVPCTMYHCHDLCHCTLAHHVPLPLPCTIAMYLCHCTLAHHVPYTMYHCHCTLAHHVPYTMYLCHVPVPLYSCSPCTMYHVPLPCTCAIVLLLTMYHYHAFYSCSPCTSRLPLERKSRGGGGGGGGGVCAHKAAPTHTHTHTHTHKHIHTHTCDALETPAAAAWHGAGHLQKYRAAVVAAAAVAAAVPLLPLPPVRLCLLGALKQGVRGGGVNWRTRGLRGLALQMCPCVFVFVCVCLGVCVFELLKSEE